MSALAPVMEGFFTERLIGQRRASAHTVASYRDTFRLLLGFAQRRTGRAPSKLDLEDLDAVLVGAFLDHLERERHNSVRTRNNRLAAIHSLFAYAALRHPEHAALIQRVLAIPAKRTDRELVSFLTDDEVDALLAAPDRGSWVGRRDHALLLVAVQTGLRVSELTSLATGDIELGTGAHLRCHGKGRKERITPLTAEACAVLRVWLAERHGDMRDAVFPSRRGGPLSSDAVAVLVARHARTAASCCPSLLTKAVTPHVLRHTCVISPPVGGVGHVAAA
ncbi:MAG: tyrosine-type recombinase/integrase [Acidimicrobiales bacterium]